jgi:putative holliday junction resolvase
MGKRPVAVKLSTSAQVAAYLTDGGAYNETGMIVEMNASSIANRGDRGTNGKGTRILAVDYGRKRIGLALSDELRLTAQPLRTILRTNRQNDLRRLREICRENGVTHIVVGQPLHMSGDASPMSDETARFAARIEKHLGIQVELADERLTSWEAKQTLAKNTATRQRKPVDDVAAAVLLRDYLERHRERSRHSVGEEN